MKAGEFLKYNNWVVVGDVLNQSKYAFRILRSLEGKGFNVEGLNPRDTSNKAFKSLKEISHDVDVIDLCINPIQGIEVIKEAIELGINKILIQPGAESNEILNLCKDKNIIAIEGCALVELSRI